MVPDRETAILQLTEDMIRQGGYNSFSFRNIANGIGIKSSSVHYHFATKEDLGVAVTRYYTEKFIAALPNPAVIVAEDRDPIEIFVSAFRSALSEDKGMCLCGMLGAQADVLPASLVFELRAFFNKNKEWLTGAYIAKGLANADAKLRAVQTISLLEGALLLSHVMDDLKVFDQAAGLLID